MNLNKYLEATYDTILQLADSIDSLEEKRSEVVYQYFTDNFPSNRCQVKGRRGIFEIVEIIILSIDVKLRLSHLGYDKNNVKNNTEEWFEITYNSEKIKPI